jgi:flagellar basal-body rod protein FlgB
MIHGDMQINLLGRLLDVASLRHRTIAQNVANVNSPGYRQLDVSFEDAFSQKLAHGDVEGAMEVREQVAEGVGGATRADGNNVDIDLEMGQLNKNSLLYHTFMQLLNARLATMRSAISGH